MGWVALLMSALSFATAIRLPLSCTFTVPAGCGCADGTTGTLSAQSSGASAATVRITVGTQTVTKNVPKNGNEAVYLKAPCTDNTKKLCAMPVEPKTWDNAACTDISYTCINV